MIGLRPKLGNTYYHIINDTILYPLGGGGGDTSQKRGQIGGPKPKFSVVFKGFFCQNGDLPPPVDCAPSPVLHNPVLDVSISKKIQDTIII
jgi:hypothetical protein